VIRFGLQLWSQRTDWPGFRDAALAAEEAGWDSVWTWDHLLAIYGPPEQPVFEGWSVLAGLGPLTKKVRLGLMVGANTYRNPGLTAKLASTLIGKTFTQDDTPNHISDAAIIDVYENGKSVGTMYPEKRLFKANNEPGTIVAIRST
jgi:hypothetical protein